MPGPGPAPEGYRPCVGVMLVNRAGLIFVGERIDTPGAWQMPQGGIDRGEQADQAALRELREETGIVSARLLAMGADWLTYDLPAEVARKAWDGRYRGQAQIWGLFAFTGDDDEIDLDTDHREFQSWKWSTKDELIAEIVPFKREVYVKVVETFGGFLPGEDPD